MRCFAERSGENLGKLRAEQFSFYPLLYEGERNAVKRKRSVPLSSPQPLYILPLISSSNLLKKFSEKIILSFAIFFAFSVYK